MAKKQNREKGLLRDFKIDRSKINEKDRTVELAFSSETPVERWGENEVLSHEKGDYDFDRIKDGTHPLLLGHDEWNPNSQIGVIESARVDSDKVGRAVVRFGSSAKAQEIFKDVIDGIRQNVSVGYDRTGIVSSKKSDDNMTTTRYRWMPTHIAIVPVPADTKAGIGRSVKRRCADCDGTGRCRCRDNDDDDADKDCDICDGDGDCPECRGNGYITTAKGKKVDSNRKLNVEDIAKNLTPEEKTRMKILLDPTPAGGGGGTVTLDEPAIRTKAITDYRARAKEITEITNRLIKDFGDRDFVTKDGKTIKMRDALTEMANEAMQGDKSVEAFKVELMERALQAKPAKPVLLEDCTDENGQREYSILRGVQSIIRKYEGTDQGQGALLIPDGLEGEVHQEIMRRAKNSGGLGFPNQGFQVPINVRVRTGSVSNFDRKMAKRFGRDMQATVFPSGGAFVPTVLLPPVIELLRNRMILSLAGKRTLGGLQGNIVVPRQEAAATAYSVSEIQALTASQQILGQIALNPKRVGATEAYSKQLLMQSTPDAEAFIRDDLFKIIALLWDYYGLAGSGVGNQPMGVFNTPGIGSITFGATPTYKQIVSMETTLRSANVTGELCYLSTPSTKGSLKTVAEALTGATTIGGAQNALWKGLGMDGEMNGYPAYDSNQVPNNQVVLGDFDQLIHAMWGGLDVVVDPYSLAANAEIKITINTWGDYSGAPSAGVHRQRGCWQPIILILWNN